MVAHCNTVRFRLAACVTVVAYILAFAGAELAARVAPAQETVVVADFPCANHTCACVDAEQCRTSCCCFPKSRETASCHAGADTVREAQPQPAREPASDALSVSLAAAPHCDGSTPDGNHVAAAHVTVHLPSLRLLRPFSPASARLGVAVSVRPDDFFSNPPDKIPISIPAFA